MVRRSVAPPEGGIFAGEVNQTLTMASNIAADIHEPIDPNVLAPENIVYRGTIGAPLGTGNFGYASGAFTIRPNGGGAGVPTILMLGTEANVGAGQDYLFEVTYPSIGGRCTVIKNHGTWRSLGTDNLFTNPANAATSRGIYWHEPTQRCYLFYCITYAASLYHDPSVVHCELNAGATPSVWRGPWRSNVHSARFNGYGLAIPSDIAAMMGGKSLGAGGTLRAGVQEAAYGPNLGAFAPIPDDRPPDPVSSIGSTASVVTNEVLQYNRLPDPPDPACTRKTKPADTKRCGWTWYNGDLAGGSLWSDIHGVNGGVPRDLEGEAKTPQRNYTQNGTGCNVDGQYCGVWIEDAFPAWNDTDIIAGAAWVRGDLRQGVVFVGQLMGTIPGYESLYPWDGVNHLSYTPVNTPFGRGQCPHGQIDYYYGAGSTGQITNSMECRMFIYSEQAIIDSITSGINYNIEPEYDHVKMGLLDYASPATAPFTGLASKFYHFGGMCVDEANKRLLITVYYDEVELYEPLPRFYVFDLVDVWSS